MSIISGFEHIVRQNEPIGPSTWLRMGGTAQYFAEPTGQDELVELVRRCRENETPVRLLGGGSNVLVRDEGVAGLVVHLSAANFAQITTTASTVRAGGGAKLTNVVATAVREGLAGLEHLIGIPGTVGGALHGNAGTTSADIGQSTVRVTVLNRNGEISQREKNELQFGYRTSNLDELAILDAEFQLEPQDPDFLMKRMQKLWILKKAAQPIGQHGMARLFKDHGGVSASELLDQAGLKGTKIGNLGISERDPNLALSEPGASSDDLLRLIELLRDGVHERLGVELEAAIEIW